MVRLFPAIRFHPSSHVDERSRLYEDGKAGLAPDETGSAEDFHLEATSLNESRDRSGQGAARFSKAPRPHLDPGLSQQCPKDARIHASIRRRDTYAPHIHDLPHGLNSKAKGFFCRERLSGKRKDQAAGRGRHHAVPPDNLDRPVIVGIALESVGESFRLSPVVLDHNQVSQPVHRLQFSRGLRHSKANGSDSHNVSESDHAGRFVRGTRKRFPL